MIRKQKVMIVEDDVQIAALVKDYLVASGYAAEIINNGIDAVAKIRHEVPDFILLDIMLPGKSGIEILKEVRQFSDVPVIMVTARIDEIDRHIGLNAGADDYICKPFSPRELVARVNAVLRRSGKTKEESVIILGDIRLDPTKRLCTVNGSEIVLTPTEFNILKIMMQSPQRIFSRSQLLELAIGYDYEGYDRVVDSHIKNLRKKIAALVDREIIAAVYGAGYKFIDEK